MQPLAFGYFVRSLRAGLLGLAAAAALVGAVEAAVCTPSIGFSETAVPGGGQYTITTGDLCGYQIIAAFVDNNSSTSAQSFRGGWGAEVISRATWNGVGNGASEPTGPFVAYFDFGGAFFATGPSDVEIDQGNGPQTVHTIGAFEEFYGPGVDRVNMYYLTAHFGVPIGNFAVEDQFFFSSTALASDLHVVARDAQGNIAILELEPAAVPEPASLALFSLGLLGFGAARRRR